MLCLNDTHIEQVAEPHRVEQTLVVRESTERNVPEVHHTELQVQMGHRLIRHCGLKKRRLLQPGGGDPGVGSDPRATSDDLRSNSAIRQEDQRAVATDGAPATEAGYSLHIGFR